VRAGGTKPNVQRFHNNKQETSRTTPRPQGSRPLSSSTHTSPGTHTPTQIEHGDAEQRLKWKRNNNAGRSTVRNQQWKGTQERQREFVAPAQIQHIVGEAQEEHETHRSQRSVVLAQLVAEGREEQERNERVSEAV
jgi:hypothetical protein